MNKRFIGFIVAATAFGLLSLGYEVERASHVFDKPTLTIVTPEAGFLVFSPNSKLLAVADQEHPAKIRDVTTGKIVSQLNNSQRTYRLIFLPHGKTVIGVGNNNVVGLWDVATGRQKAVFRGHLGRVPETTVVYDPVTGKTSTVPLDKIMGHSPHQTTTASVNIVEISADGRMLATGSDDKTIEVWSTSTKKQLRVFKGHLSSISDIAFSPDGHLIASADEEGPVKVWNLYTGKVLGTLKTGLGVRWSADGKQLSTWDGDGKTFIWDTTTFRLKKTMGRTGAKTPPVETNPTQIISYAANGSRIAVADNGDQSHPYATIYNANNGKTLYVLKIAKPYENALSDDGKLYAVAGVEYSQKIKNGYRSVIQIWNVP